jgi:hypothetical protein
MKREYAFSLELIFILLCINVIDAQTNQPDLNQMELLKQFTGTWKNESIKDTLFTAEFKPYGNNCLEFRLISVTQGKVWLEISSYGDMTKKVIK